MEQHILQTLKEGSTIRSPLNNIETIPYFNTFSIDAMLNWITNLVFEKAKSVGSTLAQKYPDKAFKVLWFYNYCTVIICDFMERHQIFTKKTALLQLPIEETYSARFYCYDFDSTTKHLFFETGQQDFSAHTPQPGQIVLYKTPEYTLCGPTLSQPIETPKKSRVKFINVTFSNESMPEPLTLKLDASYFQVGNEVLSKTHVLFLLKTTYESSKYVFDDNYKVRIMDNAFIVVELSAGESIKFEDSVMGHRIIKQ